MRTSIVVALGLVFALEISQASELQILFTSRDTVFEHAAFIERVTPGAEASEYLYMGPEAGRPMLVSAIQGHMYWTTYYPGQLWRSELDGQNPEMLVDQGIYSTTRAVEYFDGQVYWSNESQKTIYRADLDGANVEIALTGEASEYAIWDFTILNGRFYWTKWSNAKIHSTDFNGEDYIEFYIEGASNIFSIESDGDRLYFTNIAGLPSQLMAMDGDGSNLETIHTTESPSLDNLDLFDGRAYFVGTTLDVDYNKWVTTVWSIPLEGGPERVEFNGESFGDSWQVHVYEVGCDGDANADGVVDPLDLGFVLSRFGCQVDGGEPDCVTADQNGDGLVDPLDSGFVLARFGTCG